ncbi:hypothetical protein A1O3_09288 [Capronia epimyces CBS 606.96]|uniref:amidase n=1 Tax=Capronia epimyces CBS 606.96 TaxID=1182542 RepID=W9XCB0_9EURO|nr:uncharacterized protein A1O3_09288 [Capronia epimyces CBS 606.96]EXJ78127.1 hypothetical protein A1O3_09288 [Capronia epimyces CBS 606.96]
MSTTTTTTVTPKTPWQVIAAEKRESASSLIPQEWRLSEADILRHREGGKPLLDVPATCGVLTESEIAITQNYDATALLRLLAQGDLTAVEVTTAFCKRAATAHQLTNCLTEIMFQQAIQRANYLDEYYKREGKTCELLHGLPISVKDSFHVEGVESTLGYVSFIGRTKATRNAPLVGILLELGAAIYVKTNVPQTLMTGDSDNNVFGRVLNPHNVDLNAGGSSGGEGALIALRGSLLGVGTDIGGSIRIPALCCGLYGFKPTGNRVLYGGQQSPGRAGSPGFKACAGPLATSFRDLTLFMSAVLSRSPWNRDSCQARYKIGVLVEDPKYPVHPPVRRALSAAVDTLTKTPHQFELVFLDSAPKAGEALDIASDFFSLDNSKTLLKNITASGEPMVPSVRKTLGLTDKKPQGYTMEELFDLNCARADLIERWNEVWVNNRLDLILGPSSQTTAALHDSWGTSPYTTLWNCLDYPSVVIPYLKADKSIDMDSLAVSDDEHPYSAQVSHGAPISIQLSARPLHDESLLQAAEAVDHCLKGFQQAH